MHEQQRRGEQVSMYSSISGLQDNGSIHHAVLMQIIQTSEENEPLTFEVGAGEVMGNKMFQVALQSTELATPRSQLLTGQQAFDAGVQGLHIGDKTYLEVIFPNCSEGVSIPSSASEVIMHQYLLAVPVTATWLHNPDCPADSVLPMFRHHCRVLYHNMDVDLVAEPQIAPCAIHNMSH